MTQKNENKLKNKNMHYGIGIAIALGGAIVTNNMGLWLLALAIFIAAIMDTNRIKGAKEKMMIKALKAKFFH